MRICREQCKKENRLGKHGANLTSSKLELLDQLKSSLRLVKVSASASHGRESQSTGSRVDLARSTACFCLSTFSLLVSHVCQRPIKRRPTALFSSHSFEPFRSQLSDPFSLIIRCLWNLRSAFRKAEAGTLLGSYLQSTGIRDISGAIVNNKLKAGQELGRHVHWLSQDGTFSMKHSHREITCFREREQRRPPPPLDTQTGRQCRSPFY